MSTLNYLEWLGHRHIFDAPEKLRDLYDIMNKFYKKFKKAFKNGKWNDIDFVMSNFSGYQLTLEMQSEKRLPREKPIYLSAKDKQRIVDNTNRGKQY